MTDPRLAAARSKFSKLLKEIFQFDCADLDFGIYRVLNMRRAELEKFLDGELLPQVESILGGAAGGDRAGILAEMKKIEDALEGVTDFSISPKWRALKEKLDAQPDVAGLAREVFSDLTTFFGRYYDEGDFLALPRYRSRHTDHAYAIPYDGSEVKLHWANADQYYIKTTERHADYVAVLEPVPGLKAPRLKFRLQQAESDRDNNKSKDKRAYVLRAENPVEVEGETLTVWFEYRVAEGGKQDALNASAAEAVLAAVPPDWQAALSRPATQNKEKTTLAYQLYRYTRKNTADYFIHKDLGGFLSRELDFFIKNEVLFLDDIEGRTAGEIEPALQKVKALRAVGRKIIAWLAQIEDFQKRLWLKKKFVLRTSLCVSLDRVPLELFPQVAASDAQRQAWVALFGIDGLLGDLIAPAFSAPLSLPFLGANKNLVVDTRYFDPTFSLRLLDGVPDIEAFAAGLVVHGENFHALNLLASRFRAEIDCVYIDPPYNTGLDGFSYKDTYQHSSWATLMAGRLKLTRGLMRSGSVLFASIDDVEAHRLRFLCEAEIADAVPMAQLVWKSRQHLDSRSKTRISNDHEYVLAIGIGEHASLRGADKDRGKYSNPDNDPRGPWMSRSMLGLANAEQRPNLHYDLVDPSTGVRYPCPAHTGWRYSPATMAMKVTEGRILFPSSPDGRPREKVFLSSLQDEFTGFSSVISGVFTAHGSAEVRDMFGSLETQFPKPSRLISMLVEQGMSAEGTVLDFFAGSGTTGHAIVDLNRADAGSRKYVLVEMGEYFDTLLVPRLAKAIYASEWQEGRPVHRTGGGSAFKIIRLESYEDTLENLTLHRDPIQTDLLADPAHATLREDYTLHYQLDLESQGSLLDLARFRKPWHYTIKVRRDGVRQDSPVDLVETFNYLLGLRVKRYDTFGQEGLLFVTGTDPEGQRVIVVWRDCDLWPNEALEKKCEQAFESFRPAEFDVVYVNGDHHLPALKKADERWKVNLTEEAFHTLMFDTSDVE